MPLRSSDRSASPDDDRQGILVTLVDLTELRRLEGVRRDFVANVSHELKTPLTSIRGYVETLVTDELDPSTRRQFLDVIQKNADRLHSIVDDLLDLSKLESGGWRPDLEDVNVAAVINDVWDDFADKAGQRECVFVPPGSDARARADRNALRQVMANLFDNALRYTPAGGSIHVSVETPESTRADEEGTRPDGDAEAGHVVSIDVRDSGSGIPGDALPRIFERFYRADPARSRAEGGTGLGLSIVKHLVESMNGHVTATSELGKGTTIRIRLPAA
jgi:two-component system phosphate regulon sensor histidine kinase PhoR